jgi:hypothetical protein
MNPRVLLWLKATGLTAADIAPDAVTGDTARLDGMPWTIRFTQWCLSRWTEWAGTLGFTEGARPHDTALLSGHTSEEFDLWLAARVGPFRFGQTVLDPMNRRVRVVECNASEAVVTIGGEYGHPVTARFPVSCLSPVESSR